MDLKNRFKDYKNLDDSSRSVEVMFKSLSDTDLAYSCNAIFDVNILNVYPGWRTTVSATRSVPAR